jgi:hypothetical protein
MVFTTTVSKVRNVEEALTNGLLLMEHPAVESSESRNGAVRVWPGPAITETANPMERVLFNPLRDANPVFHLFESLWMLSGRNDLPWLAQFNKRMAEYSDDGGKTQPAAYGHRWRAHFMYDQLVPIIKELRDNPTSRRVVLAMWDADCDMDKALHGSKDVPCNTHCYFTVADGKLNMGVICRSNDILWGAHGANAVHFSILLEYVAVQAGYKVGTMVQLSWNYHLYEGVMKVPILAMADAARDYYANGDTTITPLFSQAAMPLFERDLPVFMDFAEPKNNPSQSMPRRFKHAPELEHPFLRDVALPMLRSWDFFKAADLFGAASFAAAIDGDWGKATAEFMQRRLDRK